jgi:Fic family protein
MRNPKKTSEIGTLILRLLTQQPEVSIRSIAEAAGVPRNNDSERKAIGRALLSLQERNLIAPKGSGRSRVYVLLGQKPEIKLTPESGRPVEFIGDESSAPPGIRLSPESQELLHHVSRALTEREPVGYNQEFLRSYKPNTTFYLSADQRAELLAVGRVETIERPAGTYAEKILDRLLIDLSWNSSRLEGNTYSLLETKRLIERGEAATGKDLAEAQMILNHKAAIEYIVEAAEEDQISSHEIRSIHALLAENLLGDSAASGRLRMIAVGIGGTTYVPLENPHVLQQCFDLFVDKVNRITDPFEQSLFSIVHLSYLQVFEDVNKRTSRLVANVPLIRENLKPLSFVEVDKAFYVSALLGVYERNEVSLIRDLYIWAYHRSSQRYTAIQQSLGQPNLLKLRYRKVIQEIVRSIILDKVAAAEVVGQIRGLIEANNVPGKDRDALFTLIENEIISLHDGNIAPFKVLPSEFQAWKDRQ